jgi:hypothetical protein
MHESVHTYMNVCMHTHTHTHTNTHPHTYIHDHNQSSMLMLTCSCRAENHPGMVIHTSDSNTYIHTYIHTHTHPHTYTIMYSCPPVRVEQMITRAWSFTHAYIHVYTHRWGEMDMGRWLDFIAWSCTQTYPRIHTYTHRWGEMDMGRWLDFIAWSFSPKVMKKLKVPNGPDCLNLSALYTNEFLPPSA